MSNLARLLAPMTQGFNARLGPPHGGAAEDDSLQAPVDFADTDRAHVPLAPPGLLHASMAHATAAGDHCRVQVYQELGDMLSAEWVCRDLARFAASDEAGRASLSTLVAVFSSPVDVGVEEFNYHFMQMLIALHEMDSGTSEWDAHRGCDPASPYIAMDVAGSDYLVVGMHPAARRPGLQFPLPALVFNLAMPLERFRRTHGEGALQQRLQARDSTLRTLLGPLRQQCLATAHTGGPGTFERTPTRVDQVFQPGIAESPAALAVRSQPLTT